jgi:hypothetical protein
MKPATTTNINKRSSNNIEKTMKPTTTTNIKNKETETSRK